MEESGRLNAPERGRVVRTHITLEQAVGLGCVSMRRSAGGSFELLSVARTLSSYLFRLNAPEARRVRSNVFDSDHVCAGSKCLNAPGAREGRSNLEQAINTQDVGLRSQCAGAREGRSNEPELQDSWLETSQCAGAREGFFETAKKNKKTDPITRSQCAERGRRLRTTTQSVDPTRCGSSNAPEAGGSFEP